MVASDGGIFNYGDAGFYGSMGGKPLNAPIVGMAATPDGGGYWEVAADGGIFSFGDAHFYGSRGGQPVDGSIVGMAADATGHGYWLVSSDGGIFSYGDAGFYGSAGNLPLTGPVVGMAATANGGGYWLVSSNGGIFSYGDASFQGSMGGLGLNAPVVGIAATPDGGGYWLIARDGGVFNYGDAGFFGSMGGQPLAAPVVGGAAYSPSLTWASPPDLRPSDRQPLEVVGDGDPRQGRRVHLLPEVGQDQLRVGVGGLQGPDRLLVHVRGRDPGRRVPPVALDHQDLGLPGQLAQAVARRGVPRIADDLGLTAGGTAGAVATATVEQVAEAAQVGHVHDLDGPEAQRAGLLPAPVDLDEAQVQVGVGRSVTEPTAPASFSWARWASIPGGPTTWRVRPPPPSAAACNRKGQPKQWSAWKCETTTTSTASTGMPQRRRWGRAVGEGSTRTESSMTKLFQYRPGGARKLPVPRKASSVICSPGVTRCLAPGASMPAHLVSARESSAATRTGSPSTATSGTGRRR